MKEVVVTDATREMLIRFAERYETADFIIGDPSYWMHQVQGSENQEAMAFLASCISYGSRTQFMPKIGQLLEWSGGNVDCWLRSGGFEQHFRPDDSRCFYRLNTYGCMHSLLAAYSRLMNNYGSLSSYVRANAMDGFGAVAAITDYFATEGVSGIVPKDTSSACKRVCMFLRWMVRSDSPVDLGLWSDFVDRRTLIMPLDTHVVSQSVRLGLLTSSSASMSAARRLTASLATVFPDDPLRGDFALFGYGVNNGN